MIQNEPERLGAENPSELGPFRILGVLGRGGMGVVYRGEHRGTGVQAAVKTISVPTPAVLSAIRREIRSLGRLRHPGIVRISDSGVSDGLPWYAMELLVGYTLRDYLIPAAPRTAQPGGVRDPTLALRSAVCTSGVATADVENSAHLRPASELVTLGQSPLALVAAVCEGLAYLHENGIVHRDLKPENIFVQAEGPPVLVDLGISTEFAGSRGREELDGAWFSRMGTLAYMSPEQIRGELVDARADLYAVGCILYECVTGRRVFAGIDAYALKTAHLNERPVPPSELVAGVPKELEQLILQLLEKAPEDRLGYADDVAQVLFGFSAQPRHAPVSLPATYLYRPPLVGREDVLEQLQLAIHALDRNGTGKALYLGGESGVGKTRLANEAVLEASRRGVSVVLGQCSSIAVGSDARSNDAPFHAFGPLLLAIADRCRDSFPGETERLLGAHGRLLAPYQPALAEVPGFSALPELERIEGLDARARVLSAAARAVLNFTAIRPVLLVIDDLQWADELSLALLRVLAERGLADSGLLVLGTYRLDEASPTLRQLVTSEGSRVIELERFDSLDVRAMVQGMLALRRAEVPLVEYLASQSNGNPFFIVEHLRTAIAEGLLNRDERGRWQLASGWSFDKTTVLPATLADLIKRRLQHLGAEAKRLVEAASVLGREFEIELLQASANAPASSETWAGLREKQILEDGVSGRLRFVHDGLREVAYAQIEALELEGLHGRAAAAIESTYRDEAREPYFADLAHHYAKCRARGSAARYFELAGERAQRAFATSAAVRYFQRALSESEELEGLMVQDARARIQETLGELLLFEGDAAGARAHLETAIGSTTEPGSLLRGRRLRKLARVMERQHRHAEALDVYGHAERELGAAPKDDTSEYWREFVQIQVDAAWNLYFMARVDELDALAARVQPAVERHGDPAQRSRFFTSMAQSLVKRARFRVDERALHFTELALAVGEQSSDPRERAVAEFARAFPLTLYGDYAAAEPLFVRAIEGAERVGDAALLTRVLVYYAVLLRRSGRVSETKSISERARGLAEKMRMLDYLGVSHANLGWVAVREDDADESERHLVCALEAWAKLPVSYVFPLQWLARIPYAAHLAGRSRERAALAELRFLLRDDQMALADDLVLEIERCDSPPGSGHRLSLDPIWSKCQAEKYL